MKADSPAPIPASRGPSSLARGFACGQLVGEVASRQKQRLGDVMVRTEKAA